MEKVLVPPKVLIIIPVSESRAAQKKLLSLYMQSVVVPELAQSLQESAERVKCLFVEQRVRAAECSAGGFNVGAMRNAGYMYLRSLFPETDLADVTLLFEDVDKFLLSHGSRFQPAKQGKVDVYYHHQSGRAPPPFPTLGSIFGITAADFEKVNGFPNIWGWSPIEMEMFHRLSLAKMEVSFEKCVFPGSTNVAHLQPPNGPVRAVNAFELYRFSQRDAQDGLSSLEIRSWTEDAAAMTLYVDDFKTCTQDTPQHRSTVNLETMSVETILNRASVWYRDAYMNGTSSVVAPMHEAVPRAPPGITMTYATREGVEAIQRHIRQYPRNRMQQLLHGGGGRGSDGY